VDSEDGYQEATAMYMGYEAGLELQARYLEHNAIIHPPQLSYNSLLL
jgi:hypothetical protein